jgi:hypothetical protein
VRWLSASPICSTAPEARTVLAAISKSRYLMEEEPEFITRIFIAGLYQLQI